MTKEKFDPRITYTVSMVMKRTSLSRQSVIRAINELKILARRSSLPKGYWIMEGSDLNGWWNSLPTNFSEFGVPEPVEQDSDPATRNSHA